MEHQPKQHHNMPGAVKSQSVERTNDERLSHEDNTRHEQDDYSGSEWEQKQIDSEYVQSMKCQVQ